MGMNYVNKVAMYQRKANYSVWIWLEKAASTTISSFYLRIRACIWDNSIVRYPKELAMLFVLNLIKTEMHMGLKCVTVICRVLAKLRWIRVNKSTIEGKLVFAVALGHAFVFLKWCFFCNRIIRSWEHRYTLRVRLDFRQRILILSFETWFQKLNTWFLNFQTWFFNW